MTQIKNIGSENRYLGFSLGSEEFGIPLLDVKEVIAMPEITAIPQTPPYFLGIMNLRGQVISVLDLRHKLGIKPNNSNETSIIVCDLNPLCLGVVVDSINSVLSPKPEEISPKPDVYQGKTNSDFITGVYRKQDCLVLFLDIAKSLSVEDHIALAKTKQAA